jgi:hypothetical protein
MSLDSYYDTLTDKVNNTKSCGDLSALEIENNTIIADNLAAIQAQLDLIEPLLISPGLDLIKVVIWINKLIAIFQVPALVLPQQLIDVGLKADEIAAATLAKKIELGCPL